MVHIIIPVTEKFMIRTKSRRMKWAGQVARLGEKRNSYNIFVGKNRTT
jgi:hypothetical protein